MKSALSAGLFTLFCSAGTAFAQSGGSLAGVVVDAATQAPLAEAVVTARSPALLGEQSAITDAQGAFEMTLLPPGTYSLVVRHDGFDVYEPAGLVLHGGKTRIKVAVVQTPAPPPRADVADEALEFQDSMTAPAMISGPSLEYTSEAIERGIEGAMTVRCVVTAEGTVRRCKVVKGLPFMNQSVLSALERRTYRPALAQGKPVDVFYTFNLKLKLPQ
jgi:TonB family protein